MVAVQKLSSKVFTRAFGNDAAFTASLVLVFLFLNLIGILNHEMWRDELQAWLIARDSSSISDLFKNLRYEGHPGLWHLCLYILSRFTQNPVAMQLFHLVLSSAVVYLFARFSPFTKLQKILFSFGYFPLFEYSLISRSYVLGVIFIFCFCLLFSNLSKNYLLIFLVISLLANTSIYGTIIAISMAMTLLFELIVNKNININLPKNKLNISIGLVIFTISILIVFIQVKQPSDSLVKGNNGVLYKYEKSINVSTSTNPNTAYDTLKYRIKPFQGTIQTILKSYVPIPKFKYNFWGTNFFFDLPIVKNKLGLLFSVGLLFLSIILFSRKPVVLFLYLLGTCGILLFTHLVFSGSIRHHGHLFILFVASVWIYNSYPPHQLGNCFIKGLVISLNKHKERFCTTILFLSFIAGIYAFSMDLFYPFSGSKEASKFIENQQLADMAIVGDRSAQASTIAGFLERKIYYPSSDEWGSFVVSSEQKKKELDNTEVIEKVSKLVAKEYPEILLVLSRPLDVSKPELNITEIAHFSNSIVADETYYLYLVQKKSI